MAQIIELPTSLDNACGGDKTPQAFRPRRYLSALNNIGQKGLRLIPIGKPPNYHATPKCGAYSQIGRLGIFASGDHASPEAIKMSEFRML